MKCNPLSQYSNQTSAKNYLCKINGGVLQDPIVHSCQTSFCKFCFESNPKSECPTCNQTIKKDELIISQKLKKIIQNLEVKCQYCEWTGVDLNYLDHQKNCQKLKQKNSKKMTCIACLEKFDVLKIDEHREKCQFQHIPCTNGCSKKIAKKNMDFHIKSTCMLSIQPCSYEAFGCIFSGRIDEIIKHCKDPASQVYHTRLENNQKKLKNQQIFDMLEAVSYTHLTLPTICSV